MKKILFLTSSIKPDHGYGVVSYHLINEFLKSGGYTVITMTSDDNKLISMRGKARDARSNWNSKFSLVFNIVDTLRLAMICKKNDIDVICCVTEDFSVVGFMLNFLFGTLYVIVAHGSYVVFLS